MAESKITKNVRLGVVVRSPEPYHQMMVNSVEEFLSTIQPEGWKKGARQQTIKIDPDKNYRVAD